MQSPEAWNFHLSRPHVSVQHNEGREALEKLLHSQQNKLIVTRAQIWIPDTIFPQELLQEVKTDAEFYSTQEMNPALIFNRHFIANFALNGRPLIVPSHSDQTLGTSIYVFPSNLAIIVLPKDKLDSLGISFGTILKETRGDFALLAWNLQDLAQKPNQVEKIKRLFTQGQLNLFSRDYKFAWDPNQKDVCPSSIAKYFHENGCPVEECYLEHQLKRLTDKSVPDWLIGQSEVEDVIMLENWLGASLLDIDPLLCDIPQENLRFCDSSLIVTLDGLMGSRTITNIFRLVTSHMKAKQLPFVVVVLSCHVSLPLVEQASKGKKSSRPHGLHRTHLTAVLYGSGDFTLATTRVE